jgi:hypothetical protein
VRFKTRYEISRVKEEGLRIIKIIKITTGSNINIWNEWMWSYDRRMRKLRGSLGNVKRVRRWWWRRRRKISERFPKHCSI